MQISIKNNRSELDFIRNSIIINQFIKIIALSDRVGHIIPLKGVSLLFSIYEEDYSRNVGDIDLLTSENTIDILIDELQKAGYKLRNEKATPIRLLSKGKFDMTHNDNRFCDLDIHITLITKKFFRMTTGDFTSFALKRVHKLEYQNATISFLSPIDEWLYLAQHYCFHLFSEDKWLKDLYLLQSGFSVSQIEELLSVATKFNFQRIVMAVYVRLKSNYTDNEIKIPATLTKFPFLFRQLFKKKNTIYTRKLSDRIIAAYWEFLFIDRNRSRIKAFLKLLFPNYPLFSSIYNIHSFIGYVVLYPLHIIVIVLSSLLFIFFLICK